MAAAVLYDGHARRFLLRAKAGDHPELLDPLGRQLAAVIVAAGFHRGCTAIVPVPSHPLSTLQRGFRPAAILARRVGRTTGLPVLPRLLSVRLLRQRGLKALGATARRRAARDGFRCRRLASPERVLLIDDVRTTGATADACRRVLLRAGAEEVRTAVWAATPPGFVDRSRGHD